MMSYGDQEELEHVSHGVCDGLAWCIQAGTRDTESTGCVIGQARQPVDRWVCECHGRRGAMYLCQTCWAERMRDDMNGICLTYGVESRVLGVMAAFHGIRVVSCSGSAWRRSGARGHLLIR